MEVGTLYSLASQQNIRVVSYPLPYNGSMSVMTDSGDCFVGIDDHICDQGALERVHLAHELGHCITGSFYNRHTPFDCRQKQENKADKWAICQLIPLEQLDEAIAAGYTELWSLAEYFGVTEKFMQKAVCYYVHGNLATELYF